MPVDHKRAVDKSAPCTASSVSVRNVVSRSASPTSTLKHAAVAAISKAGNSARGNGAAMASMGKVVCGNSEVAGAGTASGAGALAGGSVAAGVDT